MSKGAKITLWVIVVLARAAGRRHGARQSHAERQLLVDEFGAR
jgi:hypothetical protein